MNVKTKKYQLDPKTYKKVGLRQVLKTQWWLPLALFFGIIALNLFINLFYFNTWIYFFAPLSLLVYYLFWWIQFAGAPQLPQMKPMFEKMHYEISTKEILMKKNQKEGMQLKWEMVKGVEKQKDAFVLFFSKAQFIHLPFKIFQSDNDVRLMEALLRRKKLIE
ncbi:MAG: YcxB family protein [Microscillaceae bacterium]|nr:YcxB family protein [Microscillaceae bacterium]